MSLSISGWETALPPSRVTWEQDGLPQQLRLLSKTPNKRTAATGVCTQGVTTQAQRVLQGECRDGRILQEFDPKRNEAKAPHGRRSKPTTLGPPLLRKPRRRRGRRQRRDRRRDRT